MKSYANTHLTDPNEMNDTMSIDDQGDYSLDSDEMDSDDTSLIDSS
jgi:hypothetical protein